MRSSSELPKALPKIVIYSSLRITFFFLMTLSLLSFRIICRATEKNTGSAITIYLKNTYYFQDTKGKPFMFLGDYTWETFSGVNSDYVKMFDSLKSRGLNLARIWLWWGCEEFPSGNSFPYDKNFILNAFNLENNVNNADGDPQNTTKGTDGKQGFCSMGNPKVLEYQKAYIRKVVETVNRFDKIYFEIANENYYNEEWELALCDYIKEIELNYSLILTGLSIKMTTKYEKQHGQLLQAGLISVIWMMLWNSILIVFTKTKESLCINISTTLPNL